MIAITSSGQNLKSNVSARFGRAQHFLVVDKDGNLDEVISNPGIGAQRGAGVQAAQAIVDKGVEVLITGNIGPNAFSALQTAGVKIFLASGIKAEDAFKKWNSNELSKANTSTGAAGRGPRKGSGPGRRGRGRGSGQGRGPR